MIPPLHRRNPRLDFADTIIKILRGLSFDLTARSIAPAQPQPDREVCSACGCLCHPDEVCPSCVAARRRFA